MNLAHTTIIVTGASAGIGQAVVHALAYRGANVVLAARRAERLDELVHLLRHCPGRRLAVPGDIRDQSFCQHLIAHTAETFGRVDVLINNAGVGHRGPLTPMPGEDIRTIWDTNLLGLTYASQAAGLQMRTQTPEAHTGRRGQIINVSSIVSYRPMVHSAVYTASKTAVNFLSRSLRMELAPHQITVSLVYPGLTATEFHAARLGRSGQSPFGRGTAPEKVAASIIRAIERQQTDVYISLFDWLFAHLNRLFPRLLDQVFMRLRV